MVVHKRLGFPGKCEKLTTKSEYIFLDIIQTNNNRFLY